MITVRFFSMRYQPFRRRYETLYKSYFLCRGNEHSCRDFTTEGIICQSNHYQRVSEDLKVPGKSG